VVKCVPFRARDAAGRKEISMSASDDRDAARRSRQQLIERLNAREAELSDARAERPQLSEEKLEAEIERQRTLNLMRANFPIV
jgi:nucleotidyltransferase/DNA polymerase involved in DNA repair